MANSFEESLAELNAPKHPDGSSLASWSLSEKLQAIYEKLKENGIDVDDIGKAERISVWGSTDGSSAPFVSIRFSPKWAIGPEWPVVQPAPAVRINRPKANKSTSGQSTVAILPDPQIGFLQQEDGTLVPLHDPSAIDTALSIVKDVRPDRVVWVGDYLDFAEFSTKFVRHPAFSGHTQRSVNCGRRILGRQLSITPEGSPTDLMPGNHEKRLTDYILQNAKEALGLRAADATPDDWPLLSVPTLLGTEELGVRYGDAYPAGKLWLRHDLRVIHGNTVSSQGSTAATIAKKNPVSTVFGHVHRLEVQSHTFDLGNEIRECVSITPGCLCSTDGAVPSAGSAINPDGSYVLAQENWAQGVAILTFDNDAGPIGVELAHISNGEGFFRGTRYVSDVSRFDHEY